MDTKDYIGERGEDIFAYLITKWCDKRPWFRKEFLGAKEEAKDFRVSLIEPRSGDANFLVQVKATMRGYTGKGDGRKLMVSFSRLALKKLQLSHSPAYVVGIDLQGERGYILPITASMKKGFSRMSTKHPLNCDTIKALWKETNTGKIDRQLLIAQRLHEVCHAENVGIERLYE